MNLILLKQIYFAQFVNTAILLVLINANLNYFLSTTSSSSSSSSHLNESKNEFLLFNGKYEDFNTLWYQDVGVALMLTMIINMIAPHLGVLMNYLKLECKRCYDRNCTCNYTRTKQSTQRDLEVLYRGPNFELATRYAQTLTTLFIVFLVIHILY